MLSKSKAKEGKSHVTYEFTASWWPREEFISQNVYSVSKDQKRFWEICKRLYIVLLSM